jgi:hypothetical protein
LATKNEQELLTLSSGIGSLNGSGTGYIDTSILILHVKDPTRYVRSYDQYYAEWAQENTYCYSYTVPLIITEEERKEFVRKDLTKWLSLLGISVRKNGNYVITEKDKN